MLQHAFVPRKCLRSTDVGATLAVAPTMIFIRWCGTAHAFPRGEGGFQFVHTWANWKTDEERRAPKLWRKSVSKCRILDYRPHSSSVKNQRFLTASPRGKP